MEQTRYASRLRYLDAGDLHDSAVDFDGLDVSGSDGARLGDLDGFLVDPSSGRVLYTVVDSGGWFTSRRFLLPIGHASIDADSRAMRVDVTRDTVRRFPEFNERNFRDLSDDELRSYEHRMIEACCPDEMSDASPAALNNLPRHYRQPAWWNTGAYTVGSLRPIEPRPFKSHQLPESPLAAPAREAYDREPITAAAGRPGGDDSPHFGGRAQPGDVLGLETGGERTYIGDTAEDEDERRRAAERAAADDESPTRAR
jgi:hypothetical protein